MDMTETSFVPLDTVGLRPRISVQWVHRYGFVLATYLAATLATAASWMGDTVDYVESIEWFSRGVNHWMWDFAHLLWRPLGWVLFTIFAPITRLVVGDNDWLQIMLTLNCVSWLAGLVCVICVYSIANRVSGREWIANAVAAAFIFTQTFLNWTQAGSAYVPGLALLLVAFDIGLARRDGNARRAIAAGAALAGAVCLWVPYLLVVPAAIVAPFCLYGFKRERFRFAFQSAAVFSLLTGIAYIAVMIGLRLTTLNDIRAWIATSGHGIDYSGVKRMIIGFARSFINTGNEGLLFKRYLLADPFNPVSLSDLIGTTLCKVALVYVFVTGVVITLVRSSRKGILALFAINAIPVLILGFFFASSEPERYMPLFPTLFIAIASSLAAPSRVFKSIALVFFAVMTITNTAAFAKPVLDRKQDAMVSRVRDLLPRLDDHALVFTTTYQDDLMIFSRTYPFNPVVRSGHFHLSAFVSPGTSWNLHWCEDFASRVLSTWKNGGATWISKRALSKHPRSEWNWAEGDDPRISWTDFPRLMNHLELGESVGGEDGFVQLLHSPNNERFLSKVTTSGLVAERTNTKPGGQR
jgi:hypothetical protein